MYHHNMDSIADFHIMRPEECGLSKGCIQRLAQQVEAGCFDKVVSVTGDGRNFITIVETALWKKQLYEKDWLLRNTVAK